MMNCWIRSASIMAFAILIFTFHSDAQQPSTGKKDFFPFSVWYSGGKARAPILSPLTSDSEEEWRKDLAQIKDLGFNTVRTWVEWATCEPERGKYNFENLRLLLRLAEEVGLKVFIQVYVDSAPDWVPRQFPDALFVAQSGDKVYPQSAPGACTDNRAVEKAVLDFYTETARVASSYSNFFGWDLWSEPHIINWASLNYIPNVQFCFCDGTRAKFRSWLQSKYSTLNDLNTSWHRNFEDWNEVDPPRFSTILSYSDFIDWKTFIYEKLVQDMQARYDAIRKADPDHLITAHAVGASLFQSPHVGAGATDDFLMAKPLDYYGVSIYPKHNHPERAWSVTTLRTVMDFTRSANREKGGWYVGELQAGLGTIALLVSDPVTEEDHRIWVWSAISRGAKGINIYAYYPMSSGYEAGGYGLINLDGTLTKRSISAGKLADIVDRNQKLFLNAQPTKAKVGIVYNPLTQMVGGMQRRDFPAALSQSLIGYYQSFANHNIPVDFIHIEHLEKNDLSQYQFVILPYPIMFTREAASGLRAFVEEGGYILSEARIGWNDDRGYASEIIPGLGMHEVFGVRENDIKMRDSIEIFVEDSEHPAMKGLKKSSKLKGTLYQETLEKLEGREVEILATSKEGLPVIVSSRFGKGASILVGSYMGMSNYSNFNSENDQFFINLLDWANIDRPFTTSLDGRISDQVEVRLMDTESGHLLFVINHSKNEEEINIDLKMDKDGMFVIHDILNDSQKNLRSSDNILRINDFIGSKDVHVFGIFREP